LALAAAGSILLAIGLFGGATVALIHLELRRSLDSALRRRALEVSELAVTAPALLDAPGALESVVSGRQIAVEVVDARGAIVSRSLALGARLLPVDRVAEAALHDGRAGYEDIHSGGRPYRLFAAPIARAGGPAAGGAVLVASDTSDIAATIRRLSLVLSLSAAGATVLALLLAAALTRRGLRPLRRLVEGAREIERTADAARRLPASGFTDEIAELTGVLNRMLSSLERAREGERRFLADASHELRTPVTTLLGNAEYAARHGADPEVLDELRSDAARLARLVENLLALERAGGSEGERMQVDLVTVARSEVARWGGSRVELQVPSSVKRLEVRGDPDALARALSNLIENALVHGPPDGLVTVAVGVAPVDGFASVTVRDQGPGPDPSSSERLFERFWRGPDAAGRPGSGLGLSIVAAIAAEHGGRVKVEGAAFTLEVPLAGGAVARRVTEAASRQPGA
jgi:two-component system sensor histidine kinase MprB